jgi:hypothetical protein
MLRLPFTAALFATVSLLGCWRDEATPTVKATTTVAAPVMPQPVGPPVGLRHTPLCDQRVDQDDLVLDASSCKGEPATLYGSGKIDLAPAVVNVDDEVLVGFPFEYSTQSDVVVVNESQGQFHCGSSGDDVLTLKAAELSVEIPIRCRLIHKIVSPERFDCEATGESVPLHVEVHDENGTPLQDVEITWSISESAQASGAASIADGHVVCHDATAGSLAVRVGAPLSDRWEARPRPWLCGLVDVVERSASSESEPGFIAKTRDTYRTWREAIETDEAALERAKTGPPPPSSPFRSGATKSLEAGAVLCIRKVGSDAHIYPEGYGPMSDEDLRKARASWCDIRKHEPVQPITKSAAPEASAPSLPQGRHCYQTDHAGEIPYTVDFTVTGTRVQGLIGLGDKSESWPLHGELIENGIRGDASGHELEANTERIEIGPALFAQRIECANSPQ